MKKPAPTAPLPSPAALVLSLAGINRCPYCHDTVSVDGMDWRACAGCLARHHESCWGESGACGSCGGQASLTRSSTRPARRIPVLLAAFVLVGLALVAAFAFVPTSPVRTRAAPIVYDVTIGAVVDDVPGQFGAKVVRVGVGTPADLAGLVPGDLIQTLNGVPVGDTIDLNRALSVHAPGEVVRLGVRTFDDKGKKVPVQLTGRTPPSDMLEAEAVESVFGLLGARVATTPGGAVRIDEVLVGTIGGPDLAEGDVIESVDRQPVSSAGQLQGLLSEHAPGDTILLGLRHPYGDGSILRIHLVGR